jgi:cyclopropane-fatty-acyl-phospholipid synthase
MRQAMGTRLSGGAATHQPAADQPTTRQRSGQPATRQRPVDQPAGHHRAVHQPVAGFAYPDLAARWPDVARVPAGRARAAIARAIMGRAVSKLPVRVVFPGGRHIGGGRPGAPEMVLHRPADFFARVGAGGLIGFGESYMAGDWDCADLPGLLTAFARDTATLVPPPLQRLRRLAVHRLPTAGHGTRAGARRDVSHHYDLSNELFALFLDETMTYSSALFETGQDQDLAAAQRRKIDRLLDLTRVGPGSQVLEIGTGWGELAIRAAARGADVRTITLSAQQQALATRRAAAAGLDGRVHVELRDYRDTSGRYDAILSVEMIEAVGERHWPGYLATLDRLLAPGGRIGLQAITMPHERMLATRHTHTWILKYIFPGGLIPSVTAIEDNLARHTGLRITGRLGFGPHYAQTLRLWRERFAAHLPEVTALGFDDVFIRMWRLYLAYSEAGFAAGYLDVSQFLLERDQ